jgi:hypothetical protein
MQNSFRELTISCGITLVALSVYVNAGVASEKNAKDAHRTNKNTKRILPKNKSPKTIKKAETANRRELKNFLSGNSKSYKGFDARTNEDY